MRALALLLLLALGGCAAADTGAPSLARRAAEAIDPRVPVPGQPVQATPAAELVRQLESLVAQAVAGDRAFRDASATAGRLAQAAGASGSESWIAAQQALSVAVAARAPVTRALGDIDALGAGRIQQFGGIGAADLEAIGAAADRVQQIDKSQAAATERIQAQLLR